jgi:parallel beta-helix repeat protein
MKKYAMLLILLAVLYQVLASFPRIDIAGAAFLTSCTIYIRADGRVDPPDSPISSLDNITYALLTDIVCSGNQSAIVVERDNIIVDGRGYTVQGVGSGYGIDLTRRINVTIKNVEIKAFFHGIYLWYSLNNSITGNSITACTVSGVRLFRFSRYNAIFKNNMANNANGIGLVDSSGNRIIENNMQYNSVNIELYGSFSNFIYNNNFVINAGQLQVYTFNKNNLSDIWDADYPSGGNYWSNYTGVDLDHDGIGDSWHEIDENNIDHYPLMGMFSDFNATSEYHVQTICNSTVSDFQFNGTAINFNVSGENDTTGFCRICIPTALMNVTYKVYVNDTEVSYNLLPCSNETYSYLYFNYTYSTQEVVIMPEFPSFLILPLFMIATLLAVIVYRRRKVRCEAKISGTP